MDNSRELLERLKKAFVLMKAVGFDEIPVQLSQAELGQIVEALDGRVMNEGVDTGKDEA